VLSGRCHLCFHGPLAVSTALGQKKKTPLRKTRPGPVLEKKKDCVGGATGTRHMYESEVAGARRALYKRFCVYDY
jgi:hypothetical protein